MDKRIIGSVRKYNGKVTDGLDSCVKDLSDWPLLPFFRSTTASTGVTEYWKGKAMCFATHPDEKGKVILQLGTADPDLALQAALVL